MGDGETFLFFLSDQGVLANCEHDMIDASVALPIHPTTQAGT